AFLGHHVIDSDVLSYIANKVQKREFRHPVIIIDQFGFVLFGSLKIQELTQLFLDTADIVLQRFQVQQITFSRFERRVSDHPGGSAQEGDGLMSCSLKMEQGHYPYQVADMQGITGWVEAQISRSHPFIKVLFDVRSHILEHSPPSQFFYKIIHVLWLI